MMTKVTLQLICKVESDTIFPCSYPCGIGMKRVLVDKYNVVDVNTFVKGENGKMVENMQNEYRIHFPKGRGIYDISYNIKDNEEPASVTDKLIKEQVIDKFLMNHPLLTINGKPHDGTVYDMFDLVDTNVKIKNDYEVWKKKLIIANHLKDSDISELRNICYYFGENPLERHKGSLKLFIADFETGFVVTRSLFDSYIKTFIEHADPSRLININIRKAVDYKIIERQNKEGKDSFLVNGDYVGQTHDQIVDYFKRNTALYEEFIVRQVNLNEPGFVTHKTLTAREAAKNGNIELENLRGKVYEMIETLKTAGIDHDVTRMKVQNAGIDKVTAAFDKLTALLPVVQE